MSTKKEYNLAEDVTIVMTVVTIFFLGKTGDI